MPDNTHTNSAPAAGGLRELSFTYQENCRQLRELADTCESENRDLNEPERAQRDALTRQNDILRMRMAAAVAGPAVAPESIDRDRLLRENLEARRPVTIRLQRDIQTSAALDDTGIIPVAQQEMLRPLREGLIYDKLGLNVRTGLSAGKLRWPKHGRATAAFAGEAEKAVDSHIDFDKLDTKPVRLVIAVPVTREELDSSEGVVESVVREEMPAAVVAAVNDALLTTVATDAAGKPKKVAGPFASSTVQTVNFAGAVPTRAELLKMKSTVARSGIRFEAPCWVMTEDMKALLEDVKVDAGSGRFLCENDRVLGYPVFTSSAIGEGNIGFGDWSYQAAGFFGPMAITVDPYTLSRQNSTDFVLNTHFATVTLYPEAFVLGKAAASEPAKTATGAGSDNG